MKILVISQHYYPEPFVIDKICEGLVERGHEVTVVTGTPNYPKGIVYEGYEKRKKKDEEIAGVKVHRCFEIARKKGIVYRLLNYYSFAYSSTKYVKRIKEKYDVVFSYQLSPVMQSRAAVAYQKKKGVPLVLYCLDLWPESLTVGKVEKKSWAYKHYLKVSKKIYTAADKLLLSSRPFQDRMQKNFGIETEKFAYLPQHAEDSFSPKSCQKTPDGYCDLLFAGNVGMAQSVDTIVRVANELKTREDIRFHIVGGGTALEEVQRLSQKLGTTNVFFYGKRPAEEMPSFYAKADGMLITFAKDEVLSMTVPLKTQSYMAAGKPILCAADGAVAEEIEKAACGYVSPAQDVTGLKENILRFAENKEKVAMGIRAREYFENNFTKERFLDGLERALQEAVKKE
ncbi:MAG: glycosyltransferase family 4 protein [Clostridia bacterium]|nr:glycosyltransferase family 4 protein [Clostridia bacterium]